MEKPELSLKDLCNEIEAASFSVKMRGYAPDEVDAFMDSVATRLKQAEDKMAEVRRYEIWLREELQAQVVERAKGEAMRIMQEAHAQARNITDAARAEMAREQAEARRLLQQETADQTARKAALEREVSALQASADSYRTQAVRALEDGLRLLRGEEAARFAPLTQEPITPPPYGAAQPIYEPVHAGGMAEAEHMEDVDKILAELQRPSGI